MIQHRFRSVGPALLAATLAVMAITFRPPVVLAAGDPNVVHVDGYFTSHERSCPELRDHQGKIYYLTGDIAGLRSGDHVRLEGRFADSRLCGGQAVDISVVQTIWGDDKHRTTYYDQLRNGAFADWAAANGRPRTSRHYNH